MNKQYTPNKHTTPDGSTILYYFQGNEEVYDQASIAFEQALHPKSKKHTLECFPCPCCNFCSLYLVLEKGQLREEMRSVYMATCTVKNQNSEEEIWVTFGFSENDNPMDQINLLTKHSGVEHTCFAYCASSLFNCTKATEYMNKQYTPSKHTTPDGSIIPYYFQGNEEVYDQASIAFEQALHPKSKKHTLECLLCPCCNFCSLYLVIKKGQLREENENEMVKQSGGITR